MRWCRRIAADFVVLISQNLAEILCVRAKGSPRSPLNERQIPSIMPKLSDGTLLPQLPLRESCPFTHRERGEKEGKMDRKAPIITRNCVLDFLLHSQHVRLPTMAHRCPRSWKVGKEQRREGAQERPIAIDPSDQCPNCHRFEGKKATRGSVINLVEAKRQCLTITDSWSKLP